MAVEPNSISEPNNGSYFAAIVNNGPVVTTSELVTEEMLAADTFEEFVTIRAGDSRDTPNRLRRFLNRQKTHKYHEFLLQLWKRIKLEVPA